MTDEGQCGDHVVVGTKAGDCLFLDAEHDGQVMLCFPAHRSLFLLLHLLRTCCTYTDATHQCVTLLRREGCLCMHMPQWGQAHMHACYLSICSSLSAFW